MSLTLPLSAASPTCSRSAVIVPFWSPSMRSLENLIAWTGGPSLWMTTPAPKGANMSNAVKPTVLLPLPAPLGVEIDGCHAGASAVEEPQAVELRSGHGRLRRSLRDAGMQRAAGHVEDVNILHEDAIGAVVEHEGVLHMGCRAVADDPDAVDLD